LTGYDEQHPVTYVRLLDADAEGQTCKKWQISSQQLPAFTAGLPPN
jgi:hypothetical protein